MLSAMSGHHFSNASSNIIEGIIIQKSILKLRFATNSIISEKIGEKIARTGKTSIPVLIGNGIFMHFINSL